MGYPSQIANQVNKSAACAHLESADGTAIEANLECGSVIRMSLSLDNAAGSVSNARFLSNGCGYMLAAADVLAEYVHGRPLEDLHGLMAEELRTLVEGKLAEYPQERRGCLDSCISALRAAFADARQRRIEEFSGEKALVCTCFGVSEETIERVVADQHAKTVEDVTRISRAGGGCGACILLIRDMLATGPDGR